MRRVFVCPFGRFGPYIYTIGIEVYARDPDQAVFVRLNCLTVAVFRLWRLHPKP